MNLDPKVLEGVLKDSSSGTVELHLHQVAHEVDNMCFHSEVQQPAGRLQPKKSAANDGRFPASTGKLDDAVTILQRAKKEYPLFELRQTPV